MMTNMQRDIRQSERGMVSILVTMIMMIVITLIIIGISQVTRSNQREQLDQQLSTQAYYAAESGLNQATKFFASYPTAAVNTASSGNCTKFITDASPSGLGQVLDPTSHSIVLDSNTKTSYTCLMVNSTLATLQKAPLTQDSNTVWHVQDSTSANFTQFEFKWAPSSSSQFTATSLTNCVPVNANCCPATPTVNFTRYAKWKCAFGILRVDLVDVHGTVTTNAGTGLESPAKTIYIVPTFTASGVPATTPQALTAVGTAVGQVLYVQCSTSLCDVKLTPASASSEYYTRLTMMYQDADSVQLSGTDTSGAAKFSGGQAVIDVTGKAQDELRRVQARIPLTISGAAMPNYALQSTDAICKVLAVAPGGVITKDGCPLATP